MQPKNAWRPLLELAYAETWSHAAEPHYPVRTLLRIDVERGRDAAGPDVTIRVTTWEGARVLRLVHHRWDQVRPRIVQCLRGSGYPLGRVERLARRLAT